MSEVLFINGDYMKRYSHLNGSVEESYIVSHLLLAQDKYIQSFLGTRLFTKLKNDIAGGTITGNYQLLLETYVRKCTLWWGMVEMIPSLYVRLDNGGLVIRTSEDTTPIGTQDLHREIDRARTNAQFYTERMIDYLCNNSAFFPEYSLAEGAEMGAEKKAYFIGGMEISQGAKYTKERERYSWILDR